MLKKKILYVEDNPDAFMVVQRILESAGYTVIKAIDGLQGIEIAQREQPDLILMDINIPSMDGYEAATRIKSLPQLRNIPIVALTTMIVADDRERALIAGCDGYITKPFNPDTLADQVAEFLDGMREMVTGEKANLYLREYSQRLVGRLEQKVKELSSVYERMARTNTKKSHSALDNPYIVGAPVPPDQFYGRRQMIGTILAAIKAKNHVAIYGERRIGKTSLLHRLGHLLQEETNTVFVPLFIQMQMLAEDDFFGALIDEVSRSMPPSVKDSLPRLTRQTVFQPYRGVHMLQDLETVLQAWTNVAEKPLQLVFLLDEGDRLNEFSEATQMRLRGLLQKPLINQHVRLVWSGIDIDRTWLSDTSPWFNLFKDEFHVDSLTAREARRLILEPVAGMYDYQVEAITQIQKLTLNKPYLIQRLCSSCVDYVQKQGARRGWITLPDVEAMWLEIQRKDSEAKEVPEFK